MVARFEPENHVHLIVEGYVASNATKPLIVVGSAPYADAYTAQLHALADDRVRFLGGVWDQELLDQLYANALTYLHGHSVGGTNPSLLRALGAAAATTAFDVIFNREVLGDAGRYFAAADDVRRLIEEAEADPDGDPRAAARRRCDGPPSTPGTTSPTVTKLCAAICANRVMTEGDGRPTRESDRSRPRECDNHPS